MRIDCPFHVSDVRFLVALPVATLGVDTTLEALSGIPYDSPAILEASLSRRRDQLLSHKDDIARRKVRAMTRSPRVLAPVYCASSR